ncbi:MAG: DUF4339 domain-containing protein [Sandaracinaceae bacterium]|nr:DUF4339 domain-containing protein [Sandaracinaceae bacterium]
MGWYVSVGGRNEGPFEEHVVVDRIRSGQLDAQTTCALDGAASWQPLTAHPPFAAALAARAAMGSAGGFEPPMGSPAPSAGGFGTPMSSPAPSAGGFGTPLPPAGGFGAAPSGGFGPPSAGAPPAAPGASKGMSPTTKKILAGVGGCALLGVLSMCCALGWALWPASAPELELISAEIVVVPPSSDAPTRPGADPPHATEVLRVRYRTDPDARVDLDYSPGDTDDDGEGTVEVTLNNDDRERTVTRRLRAQVEYDEPEATVTVTAQRSYLLFPTRNGWRCNLGGCYASDEIRGLSVHAPEGGTVTVGTATGDSPDITNDVLAAADPSRLYGGGEYSVPIPVRFTFADGEALNETLQISRLSARRMLGTRLRGVTRGPVPMTPEGTGNALFSTVGGGELHGQATRVGDIGRVAMSTTRNQRVNCGTYSGASGVRRLYLERRHAVITIYDRRTGAVLDTHTIDAPRMGCPRNVQVTPGRGDIFWDHSEVPSARIRAWIAAQ